MSSASVGRALRRGVRAVAVSGLAVAGLGAGTAVAEEQQTDQLWIQAPYDRTVTVAPEGGVAQYRSLALGLYHDNGNFTVTDGRLTVDVSGLAGVAEVAWPANCTPSDTGTTAVCDTGDVPTRYSPQVDLRVRAVVGAAVGAQGHIMYTAEATGGPDGTLVAPEGSAETWITVGSGPDLGITDPTSLTDVAPGTTLTAPSAVTNTGNEAAQGFTVQMWASYGLDFATRFPQCTYKDPSSDWYMKEVTCSFATVIEPGATVELPEPLKLAVNSQALYDRFDITVQPGGSATDLDGSDNYRAWSIQAANTADFAVRGTDVSGEAGSTVDATFRFVNRGPAWVAHVFSGDAPALIDFTLPEGTTATTVPDLCHPRSGGGEESLRASTGTATYTCYLPSAAYTDLKVDYAFKLRIDQVIPDATGEVVARPDYGTSFPFDPKPRNNTAKVVVNAAP